MIEHLAAASNRSLTKSIKEGWVGKPKGMLQVLWERGFIDPAIGWHNYMLNGKKDNFDNVILPPA
jgi:hypothetical protein